MAEDELSLIANGGLAISGDLSMENEFDYDLVDHDYSAQEEGNHESIGNWNIKVKTNWSVHNLHHATTQSNNSWDRLALFSREKSHSDPLTFDIKWYHSRLPIMLAHPKNWNLIVFLFNDKYKLVKWKPANKSIQQEHEKCNAYFFD